MFLKEREEIWPSHMTQLLQQVINSKITQGRYQKFDYTVIVYRLRMVRENSHPTGVRSELYEKINWGVIVITIGYYKEPG